MPLWLPIKESNVPGSLHLHPPGADATPPPPLRRLAHALVLVYCTVLRYSGSSKLWQRQATIQRNKYMLARLRRQDGTGVEPTQGINGGHALAAVMSPREASGARQESGAPGISYGEVKTQKRVKPTGDRQGIRQSLQRPGCWVPVAWTKAEATNIQAPHAPCTTVSRPHTIPAGPA
jgi:hypothetical protein